MKDYYKITAEEGILETLKLNEEFDSLITINEIMYHERLIKRMKEAQEFGRNQMKEEKRK